MKTSSKYQVSSPKPQEKAKAVGCSLGLGIWNLGFGTLLFFCQLPTAYCQLSKVDSLQQLILTAKEDTDKVNAQNSLSKYYLELGNYSQAMKVASDAKALAEKINFRKGKANALNNTGKIFWSQGNYADALKNHLQALKIREEIGDKKGAASSYGNIGNIYQSQGNYPEAINNYLKALKVFEELDDKRLIAATQNNIGLVYWSQQNYAEALNYYNQSLKIRKEINDKPGIATSCNNIGLIFYDQHNYSDALKNHLLALKLREETGDKKGIADSYNNIGIIYEKQKKYSDALASHFKALSIRQEIGDKKGIASSHINIGNVFATEKKIGIAREHLNKALELSKEIGAKEYIKDSFAGLALADSAEKNFEGAFNDYKRYVAYRDSLVNEEITKKTVQAQMNYEFEKKQAEEKLEQERKDAIAKRERERELMIRNFFIAASVLMLALVFFIYRGYRSKQKANIIITQQKEEVERQKEIIQEKNQGITDSINYAQRIQRALFASDALLQKNFPGYFIFFKPKDIVSGDFYWAAEKDNRFYLAVCDSTGHGVPGAFMSLLNISYLNEAVNEKSNTHPHEIFNHVRQRLIENISSEGAQDGMDGILLCCSKEEGIKIEYAAANNAPVLVRDGKISELETDNMSVGLSERKNSFTHRVVPSTINRQPSTLYLYTDGFADQFGGERGKKFKYKQLNEKLISLNHLTLTEQKKELEKTFDEWKGNLEQVDDVLVIGIRI
ncbi:MAG: tetratricopeptide repeat protein [Bacteroidetes bacterium]|nr:tetratricopeptide repeat protein [Bacteroidota bacterium]